MPRTKGSKDKKRRVMSNASLQNLSNPVPGYISAAPRIYAPAGIVRQFKGLDSRERGAVVSRGLEEAQ